MSRATVCERTVFEDDHEAFRDTVRRFLAAEVSPHLDDWRSGPGIPAALWASAGEKGLLGTMVSEELGGGGVDDVRFVAVLVEEVIAAGATGLGHLLALNSGVCLPLLAEHASADQRRRWIPPITSGLRHIVPMGIRHPFTASISGSDRLLSGRAFAVTGPGSALVVTGFACEKDRDLCVVREDAPGFVRRDVNDALGGCDAMQSEIELNDVHVTPSELLQDADAVAAQLQRDFDLWAAVTAMAGAQSALAMTISYVGDREVFGAPLAGFENTRHRLAEISARVTAVQTLVDECLHSRAVGQLCAQRVASARWTAADLHDDVVDQCLQLHGGYGYMREYPIAYAFADAQFLRQQERLISDPRGRIAAGIGI